MITWACLFPLSTVSLAVHLTLGALNRSRFAIFQKLAFDEHAVCVVAYYTYESVSTQADKFTVRTYKIERY
ncbi:hypothetical protein F5890DRAFT_1526752 [Lentinula detonsa]|uniref:Secreted protein n=1 Tax=Lentinula detonsa TaxID=2804962 RepID=A0AA38PWC4_9AGAR|nr:hypothetical protein F5890DRAFT_1526752 [Lentinula detonsa]